MRPDRLCQPSPRWGGREGTAYLEGESGPGTAEEPDRVVDDDVRVAFDPEATARILELRDRRHVVCSSGCITSGATRTVRCQRPGKKRSAGRFANGGLGHRSDTSRPRLARTTYAGRRHPISRRSGRYTVDRERQAGDQGLGQVSTVAATQREGNVHIPKGGALDAFLPVLLERLPLRCGHVPARIDDDGRLVVGLDEVVHLFRRQQRHGTRAGPSGRHGKGASESRRTESDGREHGSACTESGKGERDFARWGAESPKTLKGNQISHIRIVQQTMYRGIHSTPKRGSFSGRPSPKILFEHHCFPRLLGRDLRKPRCDTRYTLRDSRVSKFTPRLTSG